jgi:hypothetical protein
MRVHRVRSIRPCSRGRESDRDASRYILYPLISSREIGLTPDCRRYTMSPLKLSEATLARFLLLKELPTTICKHRHHITRQIQSHFPSTEACHMKWRKTTHRRWKQPWDCYFTSDFLHRWSWLYASIGLRWQLPCKNTI